jgi:hypothetical protein
MRRLAVCGALALALAIPSVTLAQQGPYNDKQNPNEYTDTEDGQPLKIFSYLIAPIGYAFEWGVARPLHYLATKTSLAPVMSGDTEYSEIYNPGPTVQPIQPLAPPNVAPLASAPPTHLEEMPVAPAAPRSFPPSAPPTVITPSGGQPALQ